MYVFDDDGHRHLHATALWKCFSFNVALAPSSPWIEWLPHPKILFDTLRGPGLSLVNVVSKFLSIKRMAVCYSTAWLKSRLTSTSQIHTTFKITMYWEKCREAGGKHQSLCCSFLLPSLPPSCLFRTSFHLGISSKSRQTLPIIILNIFIRCACGL